jgi:hypothetical protein
LVEKIVITKRGKVRRNYLTYLRQRTGKSARLVGKDFDKSVNDIAEAPVEVAEAAEIVEGQESADESDAVEVMEEKISEQVAEDQEVAEVEEKIDEKAAEKEAEGKEA